MMVPNLSFSQSKYPRQTVIDNDKVVILTTKQAQDINNVFTDQDLLIKNLNLEIDSLNKKHIMYVNTTSQTIYRIESTSYLKQKELKYKIKRKNSQIIGVTFIYLMNIAWAWGLFGVS